MIEADKPKEKKVFIRECAGVEGLIPKGHVYKVVVNGIGVGFFNLSDIRASYPTAIDGGSSTICPSCKKMKLSGK